MVMAFKTKGFCVSSQRTPLESSHLVMSDEPWLVACCLRVYLVVLSVFLPLLVMPLWLPTVFPLCLSHSVPGVSICLHYYIQHLEYQDMSFLCVPSVMPLS